MNDIIGTTISHYSILEPIGKGGMGIVYKAKDHNLDRIVAIKFLPSHLSSSEESRNRFMREAKSAAALNHPNIMGIYEIDEVDETLFLVMEYVAGQTLKSYMSKSGTGIPVSQAIEWIEQIGHGLSSAHNANIIHRDIKTENIMLLSDGRLKIMDFGLAKLKNSGGLTQTGTSLGTLSYMSPEQIQGSQTDQRSDIWSLGVVFYELLTGELPFKAEHNAALLYTITGEEPIAPNMLNKKIPLQIDNLVKKMLQKDRENRFQTVSEFLQILNAVKKEIDSFAATAQKKAIVVLPFDNISPDSDSDYFTDGLTEELIANLSRLKNIRLVPRTTSMRYKGTTKDIKTIGRELSTRYILAGSVRKFQENLRITVELIDVESDAQLWAETYKGKLADVFDIQEQVSKQIVDMLMLKLTPTEKIVLTKRATVNPQAFDLYLRARDLLYQRSKKGMLQALQYFQKATELDPRYAEAYAGLGETYASLYLDAERNAAWLDKAIEASLKALMYDPTLSEAYAALALAYFNKQLYDDAVISSQKAIELDPNNFLGYWILGRIYHNRDRDREAIDMFQKVIVLNPEFYSVYGDLQIVYSRLGDKEKYEQTLNSSFEIYTRYLSRHPDDARCHMYYAADLAQIGKKEEAKIQAARALELNPDDPLMLYNACCFYSLMGEKQLALESLKNAFAVGYGNYDWLKRDSDLDAIRNEPEFIAMLDGK